MNLVCLWFGILIGSKIHCGKRRRCKSAFPEQHENEKTKISSRHRVIFSVYLPVRAKESQNADLLFYLSFFYKMKTKRLIILKRLPIFSFHSGTKSSPWNTWWGLKKKTHNCCFLPSEALETPLCVAYNQMINIWCFYCCGERQNVEFSNGKYQKIGIIIRRKYYPFSLELELS